MPDAAAAKRRTLREAVAELGVQVAAAVPHWPPDAFAVVASILQRSGTYRHAVTRWPPRGQAPEDWAKGVATLGDNWRAASTQPAAVPPREVAAWWAVLQGAADMLLDDLPQRPDVVEACLLLLAAADEASAGVGVLDVDAIPYDDFRLKALELLARETGPSSLCEAVDTSRAVVLPKMHTPQSGLSIRSLSHHLAFCTPGEVTPRWDVAPAPLGTASLNLLLLPWPLEVVPTQFRYNKGHLSNMDERAFRFFTWEALKHPADADRVKHLVSEAERLVGRVDALVFPELALQLGDAVRLSTGLNKIVISGEGSASNPATGDPGTNVAVIAVPTGSDVFRSEQHKHHRWRLDERQIGQYGLGSQLDPNCSWWEHIALAERHVRFWCLDAWLTFCVLICEDLARQEPVASVVRAVGPNLVIALVMDGPQLGSRWTSRYATVLAEDPGSSVLALTSIGMVDLSRASGNSASRVVALWKDGTGGSPREISLEAGAEGVVLCLTQKYAKEWTADGRHDEGLSGYLLLNGVHQVRPRRDPAGA
jgi:hypothetical protein